MTTPHVYIVQGVVLVGTPLDREEFDRETGTRTVRSGDDCLFLRDVTIQGPQATVSARHAIVERRDVSAAGRAVAMTA